jgi:hypothetical protein
MKYMLISLTIVASGLLTACNQAAEPKGDTTPVTGSEAMQSLPAVQPVSVDSVVSSPAQSAPPVTTTMLNPPHGQPNHRCDIAVGAPLSTPVGAKPATPSQPSMLKLQPQTQTAPAQTLPQTTPVKTVPQATPSQTTPSQTTAGLNPPHGQPNHRCDIAVGAPLNSPPAKKP